jgi:plastocyanin
MVTTVVALFVVGCGGDDSGGSNASAPASSSGSSSSSSGSSSDAVSISNFKFSPGTLTVKAGAKVAVSNDDSTAHTATSDDGSTFDTGDINPNQSASFTISKAGTYAYHCSIHPFMHGTIKVN